MNEAKPPFFQLAFEGLHGVLGFMRRVETPFDTELAFEGHAPVALERRHPDENTRWCDPREERRASLEARLQIFGEKLFC